MGTVAPLGSFRFDTVCFYPLYRFTLIPYWQSGAELSTVIVHIDPYKIREYVDTSSCCCSQTPRRDPRNAACESRRMP